MENTIESLVAFLSSENFSFAVRLGVFFLLSLHLALAIWVARDAAIRSSSAIFQIAAVALAIFIPIFGLIFYLLLRPSQPLAEKIIENFAVFAGMNCCPFCGGYVKDNYDYCPHCSKKLYQTCKQKSCGKKYSYAFGHCPFCGKKNVEEKK